MTHDELTKYFKYINYNVMNGNNEDAIGDLECLIIQLKKEELARRELSNENS